ncbi:hypothetical protein F5Y14DRAFT_179487 [Nemania sp. NC0429]|nr:hypothetical protein F5Y14DRAFT_179487 [Nemania sp. NC0429]
MLLSVSRSATQRLVSTAFATSAARSVVFRVTAGSRLGARAIYGRSIRGFATAGRPKKTSASKTVASTKAKKPAKKTTTKAKATTKPKSKAKPKVKAKAKTRAKPAQKKRVRKALSEEAKAILERRAWKKVGLFTEPKLQPSQPWRLFIFEKLQGKQGGESVVDQMAALSREFKALPASELQRLESVVEKNKLTNAATYKTWVESHSPQEIYNANLARNRLKKKYNIPKGTLKLIHDERMPKRPATAYIYYTKTRWASGDFAGVSEPMHEVGARIAREWKSLSEADRRSYEEVARANYDAYAKATDALIVRKTAKQLKAPSP